MSDQTSLNDLAKIGMAARHLESDVSNVAEMAALAADHIEGLFMPPDGRDQVVLSTAQVETAKFAIYHLQELIGVLKEAYYAALHGTGAAHAD